MRGRRVLALTLAGLTLIAAGCAPPLRDFDPQPLLYADRAPIRFAVERVEVVDRSAPAATAGGTPFAQSLDVPPALAAKALLHSRLAAVGGGDQPGRRVRAVITEASLERQELATQTGLVGAFTREPEAALTGRLAVRVEVLAPNGEQLAAVATGTSLRRTVPEGATAAEQRKIAFELVRDLIDALDASLEANLRQNLPRYLAPPGFA